MTTVTVVELQKIFQEEVEELTDLVDKSAVSLSRLRVDMGSLENTRQTLTERITALETEQGVYLKRRADLEEALSLIGAKLPQDPEPPIEPIDPVEEPPVEPSNPEEGPEEEIDETPLEPPVPEDEPVEEPVDVPEDEPEDEPEDPVEEPEDPTEQFDYSDLEPDGEL